MSWGDNGVSVVDLLSGTVEGQPWPVAVQQGHLHYFEGGTEDDNLVCIPLNNNGTVNTGPGEAGVVEFYSIDPEVAEVCRRVADLLRSLIEADRISCEQNEANGFPQYAVSAVNIPAGDAA